MNTRPEKLGDGHCRILARAYVDLEDRTSQSPDGEMTKHEKMLRPFALGFSSAQLLFHFVGTSTTLSSP